MRAASAPRECQRRPAAVSEALASAGPGGRRPSAAPRGGQPRPGGRPDEVTPGPRGRPPARPQERWPRRRARGPGGTPAGKRGRGARGRALGTAGDCPQLPWPSKDASRSPCTSGVGADRQRYAHIGCPARDTSPCTCTHGLGTDPWCHARTGCPARHTSVRACTGSLGSDRQRHARTRRRNSARTNGHRTCSSLAGGDGWGCPAAAATAAAHHADTTGHGGRGTRCSVADSDGCGCSTTATATHHAVTTAHAGVAAGLAADVGERPAWVSQRRWQAVRQRLGSQPAADGQRHLAVSMWLPGSGVNFVAKLARHHASLCTHCLVMPISLKRLRLHKACKLTCDSVAGLRRDSSDILVGTCACRSSTALDKSYRFAC
mmetsp:Transcript_110653/g.308281  ORF Transcript_110653/g.308281 Transcript_110653/m.308281 type:complete len:376 (+) Transcript_110653:3267-4394(+)